MNNSLLFFVAANHDEQTLNRVHSIIRAMLDLEKDVTQLRSNARFMDRNITHFSWAQLQAADRRVREGNEELDRLTEQRDALLRQVSFRYLMIACQLTVDHSSLLFNEEADTIHRTYIKAVDARVRPALVFIDALSRLHEYDNVSPTLQEAQDVLAPLMDEWLAFSQAPENHGVFFGNNYTPQRIVQLHARFHAALRALEEAHATAVLSATNKRLGADARLSILPPDVLSNIVSQTFRH
jgi:hypothetical protein